MNYYEIIYIVHPALQAGHLDDSVNQINKKVKDAGGEILYFDNWGKKKLSYLIQKQKYGTYILFQCKVGGEKIADLSIEFEHNTNILRHLISKITEDDIIEQKITNQEQESVEEKTDDKGVAQETASSPEKIEEEVTEEASAESEDIDPVVDENTDNENTDGEENG
tara:strand:- start:15 stop:512 length:498 start_codon:yes stop_codon:yes gene_type:complete